MSTRQYLTQLIDKLNEEVGALESELYNYRRAKPVTVTADPMVPEGTSYAWPSSFPFSIGEYLEIEKEYYSVVSLNRTEETWTMKRVRK